MIVILLSILLRETFNFSGSASNKIMYPLKCDILSSYAHVPTQEDLDATFYLYESYNVNKILYMS